jgi:hypothetical protein
MQQMTSVHDLQEIEIINQTNYDELVPASMHCLIIVIQ